MYRLPITTPLTSHHSRMSELKTEPTDLTAAVRLALVSGVGPRMWQALLARFGTP